MGIVSADDVAMAIAAVFGAPDHEHLRLVDVAPSVSRAGGAVG